MRRPRVAKSWSSASNSASLHPTPTPRISRPPLSASSDDVALASSSGWCMGTTSTLVPSRTSEVAAAPHVSDSSASNRYGEG